MFWLAGHVVSQPPPRSISRASSASSSSSAPAGVLVKRADCPAGATACRRHANLLRTKQFVVARRRQSARSGSQLLISWRHDRPAARRRGNRAASAPAAFTLHIKMVGGFIQQQQTVARQRQANEQQPRSRPPPLRVLTFWLCPSPAKPGGDQRPFTGVRRRGKRRQGLEQAAGSSSRLAPRPATAPASSR